MRWRSDRATGPTCTARRGRRYSHEMQSACSLASAAHSASWLRELEGADVLNRVPYQENGMRTRQEYRLTSRASRPTPGPPSGCELHLVGPLGFASPTPTCAGPGSTQVRSTFLPVLTRATSVPGPQCA